MQKQTAPTMDPTLRSYLAEVRLRHGYMRFLGLPYLRDTPDVEISRLYVPPAVSAQSISPDSSPERWPDTESPLEVLGNKRRLILLGDPGSGKSTLINWLAWRLSAGLAQRLPDWMEDLIPLPLVLRELSLKGVKDFEGLLDAFLKHPVARAWSDQRDRLEALLKEGRAIFLLDGLDEVRQSDREGLRLAIWSSWIRQPQCYWLITSRVVGYDEVPLDPRGLMAKAPTGAKTKEPEHGDGGTFAGLLPKLLQIPLLIDSFLGPSLQGILSGLRGLAAAELYYVAPFDDERIRSFARNWYAIREKGAEDADRESGKFLDSLGRHPATWRLARTPNLLTMMALIFRVRARLPDGRALLYGDIAQAYLESIDEYRGVREDRFPLAQKRRWLARVAFEMQWQRSQQKGPGKASDRDLLAPQPQVRQWIVEAMAESGYGSDVEFADEYLDFVARRSGLLLPRGEGLYAFLHLSFQEYFAAWHLAEQVRHPQWRRRKRADIDPRVKPASLKAWANDSLWRETLVFLFEILGQEPGWTESLSEDLFGADFKFLGSRLPNYHRAMLLTRLATDPHSGMNKPLRHAAVRSICAFVQEQGDWLLWGESDLYAFLLDSEETHELTWQSWAELRPEALNLKGCAVDWSRLVASLPGLKRLHIGYGPVGELGPLASLTDLDRLQIVDALDVTDLAVISRLNSLRELYLDNVPARDLRPLAQLGALHSLGLSDIEFEGLDALAKTALDYLQLGECENLSLEDLQTLSTLRVLVLVEQALPDMNPLTKLGQLKKLDFYHCSIDDPDALLRIPHLQSLSLLFCLGISPGFVKQLRSRRPELKIEYEEARSR